MSEFKDYTPENAEQDTPAPYPDVIEMEALRAKVAQLEKERQEKPKTAIETMVANDPDTTIVETEEGNFVLKRAPHSKWLPYFGRVMEVSISEKGEQTVGLGDYDAAAEFVFKHMLVSPKIAMDDIKDFTVLLNIAMEGIAHQMSPGN